MYWIKINGKYINLETVEVIDVTHSSVNFTLVSGSRSFQLTDELKRFLQYLDSSQIHGVFGKESDGQQPHHPVVRKLNG